jgi:hypothetical protein
MCPAGERGDRVEGQVQGERGETDGDELLCAALGGVSVVAAARVEPQDRARRDKLDQRVQSEPEQCDRPGDPGRDYRHCRLDRHPSDAQQREHPCVADQARPGPTGGMNHG